MVVLGGGRLSQPSCRVLGGGVFYERGDPVTILPVKLSSKYKNCPVQSTVVSVGRRGTQTLSIIGCPKDLIVCPQAYF